jgi:hypothetical protein
MLQDTLFINALQCQYTKLRNEIWSNDSLNGRIQNYIQQIRPSALQNFSLWAILGVYIWPNPGPLPSTFDAEVIELKTWLFNRLNWIDKNLFGKCIISESKDLKNKLTNVNVYPNPANKTLSINISNNDIDAKYIANILTLDGTNIRKLTLGKDNELDLGYINSGIYILKFNDKPQWTRKIIVIK